MKQNDKAIRRLATQGDTIIPKAGRKKRKNAIIRTRNEGCRGGARTKEETQIERHCPKQRERDAVVSLSPVLFSNASHWPKGN